MASVPLLKCTICLDVLKDARRLACDHCFCRTCLEDYQRSNCRGGRLKCPLCRGSTELDEGQVGGLPTLGASACGTEQTTSILDHDGYHDDSDEFGLDRLFESAPACTMCPDVAGTEETGRSDCKAVSFCRDCKEYMCELCLSGHKRLSKLFSGHTLLSVQCAMSERSLIGADKCSEHKTDTRSFFCEDCYAIVCQKCIFARHNIRRHSIRERVEFELEIRESVDALIMRVNEKKADIQRYIKNIEEKRRNLKGILGKVLLEIKEAHRAAVQCLEERKAMLMEDVGRVEHACDEKMDEMKENARCKSVHLTKACEVLERGRYGGLEGDAFQSHIRLREDTETGLAENQETEGNERNLSKIQRSAEEVRFKRVNERILLGHVATTAPEEQIQTNKLIDLMDDFEKQLNRGEGILVSSQMDTIRSDEGAAFSGTFMNDIPLTKMMKPQPVFWCRKPWTLVKLDRFSYSGPTCMAVRSPESLVVGYWDNPATEISLEAKRHTDFLANYSAKATCISFLHNGSIVILYRNGRLAMHDPEGILTGVKFLTTSTPWYLDTNENGDIFILTRSGSVGVYSSNGGRPIRTMSTRVSPLDIHVGSGCCVVRSEIELVVVSSRDGSDIWRLKKEHRQELHVAVDRESNILYVASPQEASEGLPVCLLSFNLRNGSQLDSSLLNVAYGHLVSMKVMSPDMIAICTSRAVFIFKKEVPLQ